ncbi:MAG: aminotransferase class V-fold PLP-dependent enzyme [Legionella sp.]
MPPKPIYLDYMATTPIDPIVIAHMVDYLGPDGIFGNPSSITHYYGQVAALAIDQARQQLAEVIHASPEEIVFTSGATEANNLAILGACHFYQRKGRHVITMSTEHKAVLDTFKQLAKEGYEITYLPPQHDGLLDLQVLEKALRQDTILVSIMHVNNETGVIQDIAAIAHLLANKGIVFHVDAAQSAGKLPINLSEISVDLMSFSAHKNYGPKGIGCLYIRKKPRIRIQPISFGGGQQSGLRAGTLATHQIVAMGEAFALSEALRVNEQSRLAYLRNKLWCGIKHLPGIQLNGHPTQRIAGNLNISFHGLAGDQLLPALSELAISTTSACTSASIQPSYVLQEMGLSPRLALSSIRLSVGRFTSEADVEQAIHIICKQILYLQQTNT